VWICLRDNFIHSLNIERNMSDSDNDREYMSKSEAEEELQMRIDEVGETPFEHLSKFVVEEVESPQEIEVTPEGGDGGLDITGRVGKSIYECDFGVEVKHYSGTVGSDVVRGLSGALNRHSCGFGVVVTNSTFTSPAKDAARESDGPSMRLINGKKLSALMVEHSVGVNSHGEGYKIDKEFWAQFEKFDDELISSGDVPQADKIDVLNETLRGVVNGQKYGPEIVDHLVVETEEDWTRRQADYYALAAAALGFLEEKEGEYNGHRMRRWELTEDGQQYLEFIEEDSEQAAESLQKHILDLQIFEIIVDRIKEEKIDHDKIKELIRENTEVTGTTIGRRATTVRSWLNEFEEVKMDNEGKTTYDYYEKDLSSWS